MTPVVNIPWPLALIAWTIRGLIWLLCFVWVAIVAMVILLVTFLVLIGKAGYRVGERIETRNREARNHLPKTLEEATTEIGRRAR